MNILTFLPRFKGIGVADLSAHFYDEVIELSRRLNKIIVVVGRGEGEQPSGIENLEVLQAFTVPIGGLYGLTKILSFSAAPIWKYHDHDLIYVRTFSPPEMISLVVNSDLKPTVFRPTGTWIFYPLTRRNMIYRRIFKYACLRCKLLLLYSSLFVKDILPYVDFRFEKIKEKIRIIPNAIDHRRFRFSEKEGLEFREKYGLGDSPIVLYVGRISSAKGTDILIRSIKSVKKSIQDVKCIIVGYVPETQEHRNFFNKCKSIVKEQGMENDVVFTGPIPNDQLNPVYSACRLGGVYIQPPRIGEAQSRVCLEAGSMGIPLISTPLGALPDIVREGYSGHLVPHDPSSIAEAIVDILKDHERARAFGENARRLVLEKFNWDATIPMQIEAFEEALQ